MVTNYYQAMLLDITEERRPQMHCGKA